jgi:hypothetical protein
MWESIRPAHERATAQTVSSVDVQASFQAFPQSKALQRSRKTKLVWVPAKADVRLR